MAVRPLLLIATLLITLTGCGATIGDACTTEKDCGAGLCLNRDFTPGGYCSLGCTVGGAACPAGSVCVDNAVGRDVPTAIVKAPSTAQVVEALRGLVTNVRVVMG